MAESDGRAGRPKPYRNEMRVSGKAVTERPDLDEVNAETAVRCQHQGLRADMDPLNIVSANFHPK
jgi:hypothetical protein